MTIWATPVDDRGIRSSALLTDHYELTALAAARRSGVIDHRAVFEVFARELPPGRRYGVVAGMARAIDAVTRFRFGDPELDWLRERAFLDDDTLAWLADHRFTGQIDGYRDGEIFFPHSPILTVEATFGEALLLETVLLSILNHDCAIAAAGARMAVAAGDRVTIEGGGRRTHEEAAVAAALAAYITGIDLTSNLEAGRRFGIPTAGTTMHAFTLAHRSEAEAFAVQTEQFGPGGTYLVDTFDTATGIRRAVEAAGPSIGGIRIDSGDLVAEAHRARRLLDDLGATGCAITASGNLDEFRIAELASAPVDRHLIGTRLVTGSGAPTAKLIYKLVAIADEPGPDAPMRSVAKTSPDKGNRGGRKVATRILDRHGHAIEERILVAGEPTRPLPDGGTERGLQTPWVIDGEAIRPFTADAARAHHLRARAELPAEALRLDPGPPHLSAWTPDTPTDTPIEEHP